MDVELNVELASNGILRQTSCNIDETGVIRSSLPSRANEDTRDAKFGLCSVFDIFLKSADVMPFELPLQRYLEEMLIGMHGAPNKEAAGKKPCARLRTNWQRLKSVLDTDAVREACHALFGIVLGVVMKQGSEEAVREFRRRLAKSWSLVVLEVDKKAHEGAKGTEIDIRDLLLESLPAVLVQCIYRLLVDAFAEDRSQLGHFADELLEKITHVVMHEVCGFRLKKDVWQKERKKVFQKAVIDSPATNQHDSLKSQLRREFLENRSKDPSAHMPLEFGRQDTLPLEETQLEHVMINRSLARQKDRSEGKRSSPTVHMVSESGVRTELSVDRYANISQTGEQLYQKQLEELMPDRLPDLVGSPQLQSLDLPASPSSDQPESRERSHTEDAHDMMKNTLEAANRREAEQAERRKRENLLQARIVSDRLPAQLCERSLDTAWVSPITDRLVPVEGRDRQALRKRAADSHKLKMELPVMMQSRSEPALRSRLKLPKILGHQVAGSHESGDNSSSSPSHLAPEKKVHKLRTEIMMEPPASLEHAVVLNRLEQHLVQYNMHSFGRYVKEFDIGSGVKKQRMDPEVLERAESNYVSSLHSLVGPGSQPALKLYDSPERKAKRRALGK